MLDPERAARLNAEVKRRVASKEMPDPSHLLDDGPDPLGIDYVWAGEPKPATPDETSSSPSGPTGRAIPEPPSRRLTYALGAALAASLLLGITALVALRPRGAETVELVVKPEKLPNLGTEQPRPTFQNGPIDGFISAVAVNRAGEVRVWPAEGDRAGPPIAVAPNAPAHVGPLPKDNEFVTEFVVVVVTEQPATATLIQSFGLERIPPEQWPGLKQRIATVLREQHYRNIAVGSVTYPP